MRWFYLTAVLTLPLVANATALSGNFCSLIKALPKDNLFLVYDKDIGGVRYVIAAASAYELERLRRTSTDASLEARRLIVSHVEDRMVSSSESFTAHYRFHEMETYRLNCSGQPVVVFVQDRSKLEKVNQTLQINDDATTSSKPDPLKSADENLMDALRNKR